MNPKNLAALETMDDLEEVETIPAHDIIGEEMEERRVRDREYIWAVDPIDGTTNFVNGFPMFAASIGVLHRPSRWRASPPLISGTWPMVSGWCKHLSR